MLRAAEDALERCYNSGRFLETAAYAMAAAGLSPFVFYCRLGAAGARHGTANIPLDDYTAFLYNWCAALPGIDKACLQGRDGARPPCHKFHRALAAMPCM